MWDNISVYVIFICFGLGYLLIAALVGYLFNRWLFDGDMSNDNKINSIIVGFLWIGIVPTFIIVYVPYWIIGKFLELFKLLFERDVNGKNWKK